MIDVENSLLLGELDHRIYSYIDLLLITTHYFKLNKLGDSYMIKYIENYWSHLLNAIILKDFGWKRGIRRLNNELVQQWCDPNSGHCYSEKTAMKLVKIQALDFIDTK